jgi:hypothetical protein
MTKSKKEYLAWINGGATYYWRANTIKEAVETCTSQAAQDWGGLRGTEVAVGVYNVTGISVTQEETEISPLFIVKVDVPALRKNGNAYGKPYRNKVQKAAYAALRKALWKWREERVEKAFENDPMMQELLAEQAK